MVIENVSRLFHLSYLLASKKCFHNKKDKLNNELTKTIHIKLVAFCDKAFRYLSLPTNSICKGGNFGLMNITKIVFIRCRYI